MQGNPPTRRFPVSFTAASAVAASILPLIMLIEHYGTTGGDGLGNFWIAIGAYLGCVLLSLILLLLGWGRGERPRWLILLAIVLWLAPIPLTML